MRTEGDPIDGAVTIRIAPDDVAGRRAVVEQCLRSDRMRQLRSIPRCSFIAPFERRRDGHRLRLVHPAPLDLAAPVDEFVVAQAIGSMLDGLAWMHLHGVVHGAVGANSLVDGPTGGRLSLAGACSRGGEATPADDVYAAAALAFSLLFAESPGADATRDARIATCTSPAVAQAIRAGLDPVAERRPSALSLATLVRGEQWLDQWDVKPREPMLGRIRSAVGIAMNAFDAQWAKVFAALAALLLLVGGLATANRGDSANIAAISPFPEFLPPSPQGAARNDLTVAPTAIATPATTVAPAPTSAPTTAQSQPAVAVLSNSAIAPAPTAPPPTRAATSPPPTAAPPTIPVAPPPTTAPAPSTTRAATTTTTRVTKTTRATTTSRSGKESNNKGKGNRDDDDDDDHDDGRASLLGTLVGLISGG